MADSKIAIATRPAPHQQRFADLMQAGLEACGVQPQRIPAGTATDAPIVVTWGWHVGGRYRADGHNVLVGEAGYIGDRLQNISLGWNGLNGRARFAWPEDEGARWQLKFGRHLKPWRFTGGYALIVGQVPGDAAVKGLDLPRIYRDYATTLTELGWSVFFRPHPMAPSVMVDNAPRLTGARLADDLEGAGLCVTINSSAAVEAVLSGVPTVATDRGSMAWYVAGNQPGQVIRPDRSEWCAKLAWSMFDPAEIASGFAWKHIRKALK